MTNRMGLEDLKKAIEGDHHAVPSSASQESFESPVPTNQGPIIRERKVDALGRAYATGKRKTSIARVWVKPGSGKVVVNGKSYNDYFARGVLQMIVDQPIKAVNGSGRFDVWCTVAGGGLSGQAGAVRHGIGKALADFDPELRPVLKQGSFLTRDSRRVERKKYGQPKARRKFQFSKR